MIRTKTAFVLGLCVFFASSSAALPPTQVRYRVKDLGSGRWEYTYDVTNHSLSAGIEEFTIWFDYGLYDNLTIETVDPPAGSWDEIIWQPDPVIGSNGGYDGLVDVTTSAIGIGQTVSNFSVSFDWLGTGEPGSQYYEIADPNTFEAIDTGYTTLATLTLLAPNGGEQLTAGSAYMITWSSTGPISDVLIEYSIDNGSNWTLINTAANTGLYEWLIPMANSDQCLVRISDASDPSINDISDAVFTIFRQSVVIYVDNDAPNDPEPNNPEISDPLENGSLEHPFDAIQEAIDHAYDGDTVIVLPGTYTGTGNRDIDYKGKAITVCSTDPNDPNVVTATIIDCNGTSSEPHRGFYFHNGEDANSVLSGFNITNGYAEAGGGIYCDGVATKITKCLIYGNSADYGGGIYRRDTVSEVSNCIIRNNDALEGGGAYSYGDFYFLQGWITVTVEIFGQIYTYYIPVFGSGKFVNCAIKDNSADTGGGIHYEGSVSEISDCTIVNNRAHCGGGIYAASGSNIITTNSILWGNTATNGNEIALADSSTINTNYSDIQGEVAGVYSEPNCILNWGNGNIDADPCFVNPGYWDLNSTPTDPNDDFWVNGDYHLLPDSPCIDAGDPNYPEDANEFDIDGDTRIIGGRIDIGADEYRSGALSDFSGNGIVNFEDFAVLAEYWMDYVCVEPEWCEGCDFDHSELVDLNDLRKFAENWLWEASWYSH